MNKKLYLHIGCGKTGTTSLQAWFFRNSEKLSLANIDYPDLTIEGLSKSKSGNSSSIVELLKSRNINNIDFNKYFKNDRDIILSSESFAIFNTGDIAEFRNFAQSYGFDVIVIAYVRNLYDIFYAEYSQLVTQHGCTDSFYTYIRDLESPLQIEAVCNWSLFYDDIKVINYDLSVDLAYDFLEVIGVSPSGFPPISNAHINRSLSFEQIEIIKTFNVALERHTNLHSNIIVSKLTEIISSINTVSSKKNYSDEYYDLINTRFRARLDGFNAKYLQKSNSLQLIPKNFKPTYLDSSIILEQFKYILIEFNKLIPFFIVDNIQYPNENYESFVYHPHSGYVDSITPYLISGWAPFQDGKPVELIIFVNDVNVATVSACLYREDLFFRYGKNCAFIFELKENFLKPEDTVSVIIKHNLTKLPGKFQME